MPPYQICQWRSPTGFMSDINFSLNISMHEKTFSTFMSIYSISYIQQNTRKSTIQKLNFIFHIEIYWDVLHSIIRLFCAAAAFGFMRFAINFPTLRNLFHVGSNVPPSARHAAPNKYYILPCRQTCSGTFLKQVITCHFL